MSHRPLNIWSERHGSMQLTGEESHLNHSFVKFEKESIEQTVSARFEQLVRACPDHLAVRFRNRKLTYSELNHAANRVAQAITALQEKIGEIVALLFDPDVEMVVGLLGALKASKIWVPLDPSYPRNRLNYIMADTQASLILTNNNNVLLAKELAAQQAVVINLDQIIGNGAFNNSARSNPPSSPAFILYTSGSTGKPKGVVHSHRNLLHLIMLQTNCLRIHPGDRQALLGNYNHIGGLTDIFRALLNGATLMPFNLREAGAGNLADWLIKEKITLYHSVPTLFRHFVDALNGTEMFPDLRSIHLGGETVTTRDVSLYKKLFSPECVLLHNVGCTEVSTYRQHLITKETEITGTIVPAGYPVDGREVLILDDLGNEMGCDEIGEIAIRSQYLALAYWRKPELTAEAFLPTLGENDERLYLTGDLGRLAPDGCLVHLGRKDSQVKIGGYRVEVSEIEEALLNLDKIQEAAVVVREDRSEDRRLVAYLVSSVKPAPTIRDLRRALAEKLPEYMVPSAFLFLKALPLNQAGKMDRRALPAPDGTRPELEKPFAAIRTPLEEKLAKIWAEVLGLDEVGIHDDFFALGGHSLLAIRLLAHIQKTFGRIFPLTILLQASTIEKLAEIIDREDGFEGASTTLVAIQPNGSKPPFFCAPGRDGNNLQYRELALCLGPDQPFYGLQAPGLDGIQTPLTRIEDIASDYIKGIRTRQPEGPYFLGGMCFGGLVAFEMARQLTGQGQKTALLALIDTPVPAAAMSKTAIFFYST
jgi:amino acid adenylation domain-containing protein